MTGAGPPHRLLPDQPELSVPLGDDRPYRRAVAELCRRHGIDGGFGRFPDGASPVFAAGDGHVIKLFAPHRRDHFVRERDLLILLQGALGTPTPEIRAEGEIEGWTYLLLTRLPGRTLTAVWSEISLPDRLDLARRIGALIADLHALPVERFAPALGPWDWPAFLAEQGRTCVARQAAQGTADDWLAQIPAYLAGVPLSADRPVVLHTEIMREHVLVAPARRGWTITGLLDFERARLGAPEYEFAAVGLFVSEGDPHLLRTTLVAYGVPPSDLTPALGRRLLAYALLHRYSNLRWFLDRLPRAHTLKSLAELAEAWWRT